MQLSLVWRWALFLLSIPQTGGVQLVVFLGHHAKRNAVPTKSAQQVPLTPNIRFFQGIL